MPQPTHTRADGHRRLLPAILAGLIATGLAHAQSPYYNPANQASPTGRTLGYELNRTVGCPGRGILETPCAEPVATAPKPSTQPTPQPAPRPLDSDGDGVPDERDRCPGTPTGAPVDAQGCEPDSDGDGVANRLDHCPGTPAGARVDARGCEFDSDGDGVVDRLDQCPNTPAGARVDAKGCELDSDGDGVVDRLDQCPNTPAGARVDARGCELDSDGDGVVDRLDQCPDTPAGARVDAKGCELDSDGDGVVDRLDQCPDTPAGDRVDAQGCSLPGTLVLKGVHFDFAKANLRADARASLAETVALLRRYPGMKVEIAGHTDSRGSDERNQELSERRAQAVMDHLIGEGIPAERLSARGYGESEPVADNRAHAGRALNRRVELRILN